MSFSQLAHQFDMTSCNNTSAGTFNAVAMATKVSNEGTFSPRSIVLIYGAVQPMASANSRWLMQRSLRATRILLPISLEFMTIPPYDYFYPIYVQMWPKGDIFYQSLQNTQKITDANASVIEILG